MKPIAIIFFIVCVFAFSCAKTLTLTKNDLAGTWVLKRISGGFAGIDSIVTERKTISFKTNGAYIATADTITGEGTYTITNADDYNDYLSETLLNLFLNDNKTTYGMSLRNDTLFLGTGCCDQFGYTYIKEK